MRRVLVAMSGGVDSSVTAALLVEQGFDVIGVTLHMQDRQTGASVPSRPCCGPDDRHDAERVANRLGIRHVVLDARSEFETSVRRPAVKAYLSGKTPNPCVTCNYHIKFRFLLSHARSFHAEYIATGHHARVIRSSNGSFSLHRGRDPDKDQSYVLFSLVCDDLLKRVMLPVGELSKKAVRQKASEMGLPVADKSESQDLCFFPWCEDEPGLITDTNGEILGEHKGISRYTVGQRRGLGVAQGARRYVLRIKPAENVVVLGTEEELYSRHAEVSDLCWALGKLEESRSVHAKIRYGHDAVHATIEPRGTGAVVKFLEPQRAITPGQALVCYHGDRVLGGGWITGPNLLE